VKRKTLCLFESIGFQVPGEPMAMPRARIATRGKFARMYTPEAAVSHKTAVQWAWTKAVSVHKFKPPMDAIVRIAITVYRTLPKSAPKWMKALVDEFEGTLGVASSVPCQTKPDWDNYGKLVSDALNGIAYRDDGQVFKGTVEKCYASTAYTYVSVEYYRWEDEA